MANLLKLLYYKSDLSHKPHSFSQAIWNYRVCLTRNLSYGDMWSRASGFMDSTQLLKVANIQFVLVNDKILTNYKGIIVLEKSSLFHQRVDLFQLFSENLILFNFFHRRSGRRKLNSTVIVVTFRIGYNLRNFRAKPSG